jgi:hypothetical protein
MRKQKWIAAVAAAGVLLSVAGPASAVGLGDLAKVVLGGGSILKKGTQTCGSKLTLTSQEDIAIALARSTVQKSLPATQFLALDQVSKVEADTAATSPTFCADTAKKKKGILGSIGKAAKSMAKARIGL